MAVRWDDAAVERFQRYLKIDTSHQIDTAHLKAGYASAYSFLKGQAEEIGLEFLDPPLGWEERGKPIILMTWKGSNPDLPAILFNSHMDVVPAEDIPVEQGGWKFPPFAAEIDKGNVYARGAQDMKVSGMMYLEALRILKAENYQPVRTIHVSFVPDEEIGGEDGMQVFVQSDLFKTLNIGFAVDEGVVGPEGEYWVMNGERTPYTVIITAVGDPGHGALMVDGSPTLNLLRSLDAIVQFRESQFDLVKNNKRQLGEVVSATINYLEAGIKGTYNLQPSTAVAGIDFRIEPNYNFAEFKKRLEEEWAPSNRNMKYEALHELPEQGSITPLDDSNQYWFAFKKAVAKSGVQLTPLVIFPASTDARFLRAAGVDTIGFVPIRNTKNLAHGHNEYVPLDEFMFGMQVCADIIKAMASLGLRGR